MTEDWKEFLISHPFLPTRYLVQKFPNFKKHDLDNWTKKPNVQTSLERSKWRLKKNGMLKKDARRILEEYWEFYLRVELKLDLENDPEIVEKLIHLRGDRSHPLNSVLTNADYLNQTGDDFDKWRKYGYTTISFAVMNIFPGKDWCKKLSIKPFMFYQVQFKNIDQKKIIDFMEWIWLRHIKKVTPEDGLNKIEIAKKVFYARHMDKDLMDRTLWQKYGLSTNLQKGGIKRLEKLLAEKFASDLKIKSVFRELWSADKFRKENPDINLDKCIYTKSNPVDLHHFLERSNFPEYIYHKENVIALNPQMHAFITRKKWDKEIEEEYKAAQENWINAADSQKVRVFEKVMKKIQKLTNNE